MEKNIQPTSQSTKEILEDFLEMVVYDNAKEIQEAEQAHDLGLKKQ